MGICRTCGRTARGALGLAKSKLGVGVAAPDTVAARLAVCGDCPHGVPCNHNHHQVCRCEACGCWAKHKARLKREACPIGRWRAV